MMPADIPHATTPPSPPEASAPGFRIDRSEAEKGEVGIGDAHCGGGKGRRVGAPHRRNLLVSALEEDGKDLESVVDEEAVVANFWSVLKMASATWAHNLTQMRANHQTRSPDLLYQVSTA